MRSRILQSLLLLTSLLLSAIAVADTKEFGDYTVHYLAVNSTFLTPEIPEQYGIVRSRRSAFINISVLHNNDDGSTTAVPAMVAGGKYNLIQRSTIEFNEIREGDAIYYIGEFDFSNAEKLRFNIDVQPEHQGKVYQLEWQTQLYAE